MRALDDVGSRYIDHATTSGVIVHLIPHEVIAAIHMIEPEHVRHWTQQDSVNEVEKEFDSSWHEQWMIEMNALTRSQMHAI